MEGEAGNCIKISNAVIVNPGTGDAPELPVINNNGPFCKDAIITLSTEAVSGGSYSWTGPGGFSSSSRNVSISDASVNDAGEYELVVTVGDCSSNPATTIVEVIDLPDFSISSESSELCDGFEYNPGQWLYLPMEQKWPANQWCHQCNTYHFTGGDL